jgi:hypothetical protein
VKGQKLNGIWGEFLWQDEVVSVLEDGYMERDWEDYNFLEEVDQFRAKVIRYIVEYSDPDYIFDMDDRREFFEHDDISRAVTLIAENKIWDDQTLKKLTPILYKYKAWTDKDTINDDPKDVDITTHEEATWGGIDWMNDEIYYTDVFEKLEKENWKRFVLPEYHIAVDKINLTELKKNLKDEL